MSKEFYKYISNKLINFFKNNTIKVGDKYYLELDDENQVKNLYETIQDVVIEKNDPEVQLYSFSYSHDGGKLYETYSLQIDEYNIIIANSFSTSNDYLVSLRNAVTEQKDPWTNSILVILCHDIIDSIQNGMHNLQNKGMPLNFKTITDNLLNELNDKKRNISEVDKAIIKFHLDQKINDIYDTTLWDYEDILSLVNKGKVEKEDLKKIGLFHDRDLSEDLKRYKLEEMIQENYEEFQKISSDHEYDNTKEKLAKRYNDSGVNNLSRKDWYDVDFSNIRKYKEKNLESLEYIENKDKHTTDGKLVYWEKADNDKNAGLRKRSIIVFNNSNLEKIKLKFSFDKKLNKEYIQKQSKKYAKIKNNDLMVTIISNDKNTTFAKVQYKHKNLNKLKYEFRIAIVNCDEDILSPVKSLYTVEMKKGAKRIGIINDDTGTQISFGKGDNVTEVNIDKNDKNVEITSDDLIKISQNSLAWEENEKLQFNLVNNSFEIPITIREEIHRVFPTTSINLWNLKRENKLSFIFNGKKVIQGVKSFLISNDFKRYLSFENQIITNKIYHGYIDINNHIIKHELTLSDKITEKYDKILDYFENYEMDSDRCGYPSLVYIDSKLEELYVDFLETYNEEIENIEDGKVLSDMINKYDLHRIGIFETDNEILFSSLSPINMAYQLEVKKQLDDEKIDFNILNRINSENLVPYIYNTKDQLFKPINDNVAKEWITYEKDIDVSIGTTNQFISKVIEEKISQFISHFSYLFDTYEQAPIYLNTINIKYDKEIVKGVFNFIYNRLQKNRDIIPVELNIYNDADNSYFDKFFECDDENDFKDIFGISIKSKEVDPSDILHLIQNNIVYYKNHENHGEYNYAHISFYKVGDTPKIANDKMKEIETGLSLNGILSETTAYHNKKGYRIGFGTKGITNETELLVRTAINTNEIMENSKNNGEYTYNKENTIIAKPMAPEEKDINNLYETSHWVTFIEPTFGLEYFDNKNDLIIIHYSDQYTSSSKYDTITVTNKNKEYKEIIKTFLDQKDIKIKEENINNTIKLFNGINGEWLLRIISNYSMYNREKLSIISALKYSLSILNHKDIIWIPISMDEILRIAGTVGLSKNDGLFKPSLLKGHLSDDLLIIGIHKKESDIEVYYYPIEVKEGINDSNVEIKAEEQLKNTYKLIKNQCFTSDKNQFKSKFYRNFFIQIAMANFKKLYKLNLWNENEIELFNSLKSKLNNDMYTPSLKLESVIKKGAVFSFKRDSTSLRIDDLNEFLKIEMPSEYAYTGVAKTFEEINNEISQKDNIIEKNKLLKNYNIDNLQEIEDNHYLDNKNIDLEYHHEVEKVTSELSTNLTDDILVDTTYVSDTMVDMNSDDNINNTNIVDNINTIKPFEDDNNSIEYIRLLIGTLQNSNQKLFWEYGNEKLSNRHLLILGKSGYGKTYFIQCLIAEMSKQNVPTLIIDYSDAFTTKEIKPELNDYLGDNLVNHYVKINKFPLDPFKKHIHEFDGNYYNESNEDVASRIKSIFSSVYNLGIVQQNTLRTAIIECMENKEHITFQDLIDKLKSGDKNAISVLSQINEFLSFKPFDSDDTFEWSELDKQSKKVIIIQLNAFSNDIQKIITEFILWDLWNYKQIKGDESKPFNIILDEAQNLNFSEDSPCIKILKEGRKFGWSAWFSTQSIKSLVKKIGSNPFNMADEKVYFHPMDNTRDIASEFTTTKNDKNYWATKLSELKKAECVVIGPTINNGELSSSKPYTVTIDSLKDRLS